MKLPKTSIIFARNNISCRSPSFLCFCPKFSIALCQNFPGPLPEFRGKAVANFPQISNGKFGKKQWENLGKSNEKTRKAARHIFRAKIIKLLPEFSIAFSLISHCFCPNFLLLFPEFPIAFVRISHCFCPNFSFSDFFFFLGGAFWGGGAQCPPLPPPPRLLRL